MELFDGATAVRLRSHHNKYLVAKADAKHVSQDPSATAVGALWSVEYFGEPCNPVLRLKSCYERYLMASDEFFLLNLTGFKVLQILPGTPHRLSTSIEWQAIREGTKVRLRIPNGNYLCANCGIGRCNSVTNERYTSVFSEKWLDWDVEVVPPQSLPVSRPLSSSHEMEPPFRGAKLVRLRSHHNMYLVAEEDLVRVSQYRNTDPPGSLWTVDLPLDAPFIRLKSCHDRYLTASDEPFLLGITGCKVTQTIPARLDSSVEWEPIVEGNQVKLKHRNGRFLRANGRVRPWRHSVTNDIPLCNPMKKWLLWDVQIEENYPLSTPSSSTSTANEKPSSSMSPRLPTGETSHHSVADDDHHVNDDAEELEETQHGGINYVLQESGERKAPSSSPRSASF